MTDQLPEYLYDSAHKDFHRVIRMENDVYFMAWTTNSGVFEPLQLPVGAVVESQAWHTASFADLAAARLRGEVRAIFEIDHVVRL